MPELLIGCSGFNYKHWRKVFYPERLPQRRWLEYYCTQFRTVELNVTFYRLPPPASFDHWRDATPDDFRFAVKGSRFITHIKRMRDVEEALERFFAGTLRLEEKLAAVLWQFPPSLEADPERLAGFLKLLAPYGVRNAFEFRHHSWIDRPEVAALCRDAGAALCMAEYPAFNMDLPLTADFAYFRRHGHGGDQYGRFPASFVKEDAKRVTDILTEGLDLLFYYNNDMAGSAIVNARELAEFTGRGAVAEPSSYEILEEKNREGGNVHADH